MANMTNPLSGDKITVILKDLPDDIAEELARQAAQRGIAASELAQELISRHVEAGGEF
jgi:hypothetical protein